MTTSRRYSVSQRREVRAWGIRRKEVDINQLALAYYLLARRRIDEQGHSTADDEDPRPPEDREAA